MHDGKDVNLVVDVLVKDSEGKTVCLPKVRVVGWQGEEAFFWHGVSEFRIRRENADGVLDVIVPAGCSLARLLLGDEADGFGAARVRVWTT